MPRENRKRGRREEKKRKWVEEEQNVASKRHKQQGFEEDLDAKLDAEEALKCGSTAYTAPGDLPFYGLLDADEQEYFKKADTILELNQFNHPDERDLFLANIYKEAYGKELRIANSQSCSRLMERLILLSTSGQLKALFRKFGGHFLHLVQHRFASHCCEALFLQAAPIVSQELATSVRDELSAHEDKDNCSSMEQLFLGTLRELQTSLGYLMTDQFASHPLRVLLILLAGMDPTSVRSYTLLQSRKKENIFVSGLPSSRSGVNRRLQVVPVSFSDALDMVITTTVEKLDTTSLRALATHPVANPVLQLLLELELTRPRKQSAKERKSLFCKLLSNGPLKENTESISFIKFLLYDRIGSRLLETIVIRCPSKMFKALYRSSFRGKIGVMAKNEVASFVITKIIERLNKDDLHAALAELCPQIGDLVKRSRISIIRTLIQRCRARHLEIWPISSALIEAYGENPSHRLSRMLEANSIAPVETENEYGKLLGIQDSAKIHKSLLAQCMLEEPGPLREFINDGLLAMEPLELMRFAKDRTASRVLQSALIGQGQTLKFRRMLIPRFYGTVQELAVDTVASHVVDSFWAGTNGLMFIRERVAVELAEAEHSLRSSVSGRAVWRNWNMDIYRKRRAEWSKSGKSLDVFGETGSECAGKQIKKAAKDIIKRQCS